ncbi:hypothetical protein W97_09171 [Coniosporium apollinis CBS 100218]|uniref:Uncharacterized protein n=1 Tax=Coniosporium apollinis (strain CBS 100218) TaxID=1168221 RepID=R7Z6W6_CONA1|nr:uncharacterized protein W97_09171 [Coniosporium apollinis CBS 100218]EON69907.1 hypothetical protein W97_09171 [Coniosporium apollinis CBS 100218]
MERSRLKDVFADYKTTPAILKFLTNIGVGRRQRADKEEARNREEDKIRGWVEEEEGGAEEGEHDEWTQNRGLKPEKVRSREQGTAYGDNA